MVPRNSVGHTYQSVSAGRGCYTYYCSVLELHFKEFLGTETNVYCSCCVSLTPRVGEIRATRTENITPFQFIGHSPNDDYILRQRGIYMFIKFDSCIIPEAQSDQH